VVTPQVLPAPKPSHQPRTHQSHRSRYERVLGAALGLAVAATAAVAFAAPTATSGVGAESVPGQQTSTAARGKATVPAGLTPDVRTSADSSL
jgi:hypothetical protein